MTKWTGLLIAAWFSVIAVNHLPMEDEPVLPELIRLQDPPPEIVHFSK
jgi:hypothetical protein